MVDRDLNDVYKKLAELPLRRFAEVLRNKAQDLVSQLGQPAYYDQYPSKRVPWIFSRTYGPIPLTSTRTLAPSEVLDNGTATAGGAFTLTDAAQAWTVDEFAGFLVTITAGTGVGQTRIIASNTATVLTTTTIWTTIPDATSVYEVLGLGFNQLAQVANPSAYLLPREARSRRAARPRSSGAQATPSPTSTGRTHSRLEKSSPRVSPSPPSAPATSSIPCCR